MSDARLDWDRDGPTWPNRDASRFVEAAGLRWHVQVAGSGPVLLLVHGTGASTHSWRDLVPLLARRFTVVVPDLPGHAFTRRPDGRGMSLPGMASGLAGLLRGLGLAPAIAAGHSAGAAILARMCLDGTLTPHGLVGVNAALLPIGGIAGRVFSPLAKLLAGNEATSRLFSWWAGDADVVARMIHQTGSRLDAAALGHYARLARDPGHTAGALAMMANWDLAPLERQLPRLAVPLLLVAGERDGSIPASDAYRVRRLVPRCTIETMRGTGHLAHEERPDVVATTIARAFDRWTADHAPGDPERRPPQRRADEPSSPKNVRAATPAPSPRASQ